MLTITCIHNNRPLDVDNIPKPVIDALKGLVFTDDRQITDMLCRKRQLLDLLIAHKPGESAESLGESVAVIVRAKKAQRKSKDIGELAVLLRNKPGWKFSLALVETNEQLALPGNSTPFNREDIRRCSAEAERLLASGSPMPRC